MPDYKLDIPSDNAELMRRLAALFPEAAENCQRFVAEIHAVRAGFRYLSPPIQPIELLRHLSEVYRALQYVNSTLQDAFDKFKLPQAAQTLLALQWPDFLLPPDRLSFYAWVILFTGYQEGAFYPTQHFDRVINALVDAIVQAGREVLLNHQVTDFSIVDKTVTGATAIDLLTHETHEYLADTVICNIDPKQAAAKIGIEKLSRSIQRKLNYDYSPSNFMAYCVV